MGTSPETTMLLSSEWPCRTEMPFRSDGAPVDGRALAFRVFRQVVVHRERHGHIAGDHHVVEQRMALPHRDAVLRHQVAEELDTGLSAQFFRHAPEPLLVLCFDAELALPLPSNQL